MTPDYIKLLIDTIKLKPSDYAKSSNEHQNILCLLCNNIFIATPKSKVANYRKHGFAGCPSCTRNELSAPAANGVKQRIIDIGYIFVTPYKGYKHKSTFLNTNCKCGRSWETTPERILSGRSFCKPCNDDRKRKRFDELNALRTIVDDGTRESYMKIVRKLTNDNYKLYKNIINPDGFERVLSGRDGYHLDHIVAVTKCYRAGVPAQECAAIYNLRMIRWQENAKKWAKPTEEIPVQLRKYFKIENKLHDKIKDILYEHTYDTYFQLNDMNYDFKIDNVLIKICPFSDYLEQFLKTKSFLTELRNNATGNGYSCLIIFENEIVDDTKFNIVKSRIYNKLKNTSITKIYARKCDIVEISTQDKTIFLDRSHLQGATSSLYNYGLMYNNEIVASMTFSPSRSFLSGNGNSDVAELVRYATKPHVNVVGGASRLFKHFIKNNTGKFKHIISYSDLRWGDGKMYEQLGMQYKKTTQPNYWYLINGTLKHRYAFSKHKIKIKFSDVFDENLSEYANMRKLGYDRIWDCGSKLFTYAIL